MPLLTTGAGKFIAAASGAAIFPGASVAPQLVNFTAGLVTFSGLNGGVNYPAGAVVFIGFYGEGNTPTSPQIGGQTATKIAGASDGINKVQVWTATMPGTSQPDTFTFSDGSSYFCPSAVGVYFTGITAAPTAADVQQFGGASSAGGMKPPNAIAIPTGGFGWVFGFTDPGVGVATGNAVTWDTTTPSFITSASGDTNAVLNTRGEIFSAHTTKALTGATSWKPSGTASPNDLTFGFGMATIAVGP